MGLFGRLLGKSKQEQHPQTESPAVQCPHTALVPRWDALEDMGKTDKVSSYTCTACNRSFSQEEARPYLG